MDAKEFVKKWAEWKMFVDTMQEIYDSLKERGFSADDAIRVISIENIQKVFSTDHLGECFLRLYRGEQLPTWNDKNVV